MSEKDQCTNVWDMWEKSRQYMSSKNFFNVIKQAIDFYEGKQWTDTPLAKNFPKVMINIVKMIVDNKTSNIISSPISLNFVAGEEQTSTNELNNFTKYILQEMGIENLDRIAVLDGELKGTYIYYVYWDDNAIGKRGNFKGALRASVIDMRNFAVSNPTERDIQKQKWVIYRERADVKEVKKMADKNNKLVDISKIVPDENRDSNGTDETEQEDSGLCTVLTRFFRIDGEVYYEKSVRGTYVHGAKPMNPYLNYLKLKKKASSKNDEDDLDDTYEIDPQTSEMQDEAEKEYGVEEKFHLYPFEVGSLSMRDGSIFGMSEVDGMIFNQKVINYSMSLVVKNIQDLGFGKLIVAPGFLNGQKITNTPGEVLVDKLLERGQTGIRHFEGQQLSNSAVQLPQLLIDLTRMMTNASEVFTGDMISKDLSGVAITALQAQANKPIDAQRKAFFSSRERLGRILELFFKFYYDEEPYPYEKSVDEIYEEAKFRAVDENKVDRYETRTFRGKDYIGKRFSIVAQAGMGSQYSDALWQSTLNALFLNGTINNMSSDQLELFVEMYPDSAFPKKAEFKTFIRKQREQELAQKEATIQQLSQTVAEKDQTIGQLANKLEYADEYVKQLKNQFTQSLSVERELKKTKQEAPTVPSNPLLE